MADRFDPHQCLLICMTAVMRAIVGNDCFCGAYSRWIETEEVVSFEKGASVVTY